MAAHPSYTLPTTGTAGVRFKDIDATRVIITCIEALAENPGDSRLQFQLARGYHKSRQYREAANYYRKAGEQGFAPAQMTLGYFYANGLGVLQDPAMAAKWLRAAADQGDADAQFSLGTLYAAGQVVPQNHVEAYKWASLAAAQGNETAIEVRDRAASQLNPAQIAEAKQLAQNWKTEQEGDTKPGQATRSNGPIKLAMAPPVDGVYESNRGQVTLSQSGSQISGTYACCGGGKIMGTRSGNKIDYSWTQSSGSGKGVLTITQDGLVLNGAWGVGESATGGGGWTLLLKVYWTKDANGCAVWK